MPLEERGVADRNAESCEACRRDRAAYEVWNLRVCRSCAADWFMRAPTSAHVRTHSSMESAPEVYRAFTERWLEKRRKEAA